MVPVLTAAAGAFLASAAFGLLYNVRSWRLLLCAGLIGALGTAVYQSAVNGGLEAPAASFYGAIAFTCASWVSAQVAKVPLTTFTAPALIPLVPGGDVYRMMVALLQGEMAEGFNWGLQALAVAGMLILGMVLVSAVPYALAQLREERHDWDGSSRTRRLAAHGVAARLTDRNKRKNDR